MTDKKTHMTRTHKLGQKHLFPLINFAFKKFIDPVARATEDEAQAKFVDLLRADIDKVITPQIEFLKLTGIYNEVTRVILPYYYPTEKVGKSFTRPDGVVIERDDKLVKEQCAGAREFQITRVDQLTRFKHGASRPRAESAYWEERLTHITLDTPVIWFDSTLNFEFAFEHNASQHEHIDGYELELANRDTKLWIREETVDALIVFLKAVKARCQAEDILWRAAIDVIKAAPTMEELKNFWPEAALIEDELFPKPIAKPNAVLVINDDTKKLLCTNMGARGVESAACAA